VRPAQAREKRHAEEVHIEHVVGNDERGQIAHHDVPDLDHAQIDLRGAAGAVRGVDADRIVALLGMEAEPRRIALPDGDLRGAGVDQEQNASAIDPRLDREMPAGARTTRLRELAGCAAPCAVTCTWAGLTSGAWPVRTR